MDIFFIMLQELNKPWMDDWLLTCRSVLSQYQLSSGGQTSLHMKIPKYLR